MSEGGLAVAAAEMAFAGGLGIQVELGRVPHDIAGVSDTSLDTLLLFAESNTRFVCEVPAESATDFATCMSDVPHAEIGAVTESGRVQFTGANGTTLIDATNEELKRAWQAPLDWK